MEGYDVNKLWFILLHDRFLQSLGFAIFLVVLLTTIFFGIVSGLSVSLAYFGGAFAFYSFLRYEFEITKYVSYFWNSARYKSTEPYELTNCNVCGDLNCNREKVVHKEKPWAGLMLPIEVDEAIEALLEKTLTTYVESWFKNITPDVTFLTEIRCNIRYAASVVLNRALKIDLTDLICHKLLPAAVRHLEICLHVKTNPVFHPALYNRKAELDYVRLRVKNLLPYLIEERNLTCSLYSTLVNEILGGWLLLPLGGTSDTGTLNNLLLLLLSDKTLTQYPLHSKENVIFLESFIKKQKHLETNSLALHPDMCTVLKDQPLLYAFMQFLKEQGAVHILQFCLDVEQFNKRMLTPELTSDQLDALHRDAWDLFSVYFSPHSPDSIGFPPDLVSQMRKLISKDVTKLRTSRPLFQAYEHAYSLLDNNYCPLFHTSDEFYTWLCGPRTPCSFNISGSSSPSLLGSPGKHSRGGDRRSGNSGLGNRLHKIKGALKHQTVLEGTAVDSDVLSLEADTEFAEELTLMEDVEEERDLSSWRVRVRDFGYKIDPTTGKPVPLYILVVQMINPEGIKRNEWRVERKLGDFYALEAKLTEFHGDFPDSQLPPCGLLAPSPPTEPSVYESYVQKLLANPSLRGSDLLHWFLSAPEFTLEENALGRFFKKSVPISLRKERGQNIEPFLSSFFSSTDVKSKSSKNTRSNARAQKEREVIDSPASTETLIETPEEIMSSSIIGDQLAKTLVPVPLDLTDIGSKGWDVSDPDRTEGGANGGHEDNGVRFLKLPPPLVKLALAIHSLLQKPLDSLCRYFLDSRIKSLLVPKRIAHLINLLQWVLYEKQTKSDPKEIASALVDKIARLKGWPHKFYETLYMLLQNPILNKQLYYIFFDTILDELFPEASIKNEGISV